MSAKCTLAMHTGWCLDSLVLLFYTLLLVVLANLMHSLCVLVNKFYCHVYAVTDNKRSGGITQELSATWPKLSDLQGNEQTFGAISETRARLCAKCGSRVTSKMARERASSGLPMMDDSLFVGPRIPDEIKRMIPHLTAIDKFLFRKILQGNLA